MVGINIDIQDIFPFDIDLLMMLSFSFSIVEEMCCFTIWQLLNIIKTSMVLGLTWNHKCLHQSKYISCFSLFLIFKN